MRLLLPLSALAVLSLVTSCVGPPRAPVAPPPVRVVAPPPPAAPAVLPTDWRDWPQTPGDWRYERTSSGSQAQFSDANSPLFTIACRNDRRVLLDRPTPLAASITIRTSSLTRSSLVGGSGDPPAGGRVVLTATDPLLDALAFSRGRFVVELAGAPPLVLPAWAEVGRVIEDCRG